MVIWFYIRDNLGIFLSVRVMNCGNAFMLIAEAIGLREGVREVRRLGLRSISVEEDNLSIINSVSNAWLIYYGK